MNQAELILSLLAEQHLLRLVAEGKLAELQKEVQEEKPDEPASGE